jgi:dipeptidyl-peptidase-4
MSIKRSLTIDDIFGSESSWDGASLKGFMWASDGSAFFYMDTEPGDDIVHIYREQVIDGERTIVVDGRSLVPQGGSEPVPISGFQVSDDGRHLLIAGPSGQPRLRYTATPSERKHYIYTASNASFRPLSDVTDGEEHPKFSPDGGKVGFVRGGNLFVVDVETGSERQLTLDGGGDILNGVNRGFGDDGWLWSPDGGCILYVQVDQSMIRSFPLVDYMPHYPKVHMIKYPKSGEESWKLRIGALRLETGETTWLKMDTESDVYYPFLKFTRDPLRVAVIRLNREQNRLELLFTDVASGEAWMVLTETDPYFVNIYHDLRFLEDSDRFIWASQRSGYKHAYLYDYEGQMINQITTGDWEINAARTRYAVLGVDEEDGWMYFEGKRDGVIEQHLYRVRLDGTGLERLSKESGWHITSLSPDTGHFVKTFSDVNTPPRISLHRADGGFMRWVKRGEMPGLGGFSLAEPEFLSVRTGEGVNLNAVMLRPVDFDPGVQYPVVIYAYGGVSSQTVVDRWGGARGLWHQMMAQRGFIVFSIDNRGTGGRGKDFENYMYQNLGTMPLQDQIEGVKYLSTLPYVDASRVGIWGRSAGGYLTCLALTEGSNYFKVGVAHASVTNYLYYSSAWAERYMGLPQDNMAAYEKEAVVTYVEKMKGHLLLVHGMADDNVQLQNTLEVVDALQDADKQFDLMLYHGCDHGLRGGNTQRHLFRMMAEYFQRHL